MNRRNFLSAATLTAAGTSILSAQDAPAPAESPTPAHEKRLLLSLKCGMAQDGASLHEKFSLLQELGYDGVELDSPGGQNKEEALAASQALGFPIHGVVDSIHWGTRLSDPSAEVRARGLAGLQTAIRESRMVGGTSVLLVPGVVDKNTTQKQAWDRSLEQVQRALPLAAQLGIHILIENVWNGMFYDPKGNDNQSADRLANYLDEANSPWFGSYFDIGNHQRFAEPAEWIRTLGKRIVKMDVKDWGKTAGFSKIGAGDVDWPEVRKAIAEINFSGWMTAEVGGGDRSRCAEILANMQTHVLGRRE